MQLVDFNTPILDVFDKEIILGDEPLRLGHICVNSLTASDDDEDVTPTKKLRWFRFAQKLIDHDPNSDREFKEKELSPQQVEILGNRVEKNPMYKGSITIFARAKELLNGGAAAEDEDEL